MKLASGGRVFFKDNKVKLVFDVKPATSALEWTPQWIDLSSLDKSLEGQSIYLVWNKSNTVKPTQKITAPKIDFYPGLEVEIKTDKGWVRAKYAGHLKSRRVKFKSASGIELVPYSNLESDVRLIVKKPKL